MFARVRGYGGHERNGSVATTASNAPPLVSPLQMNFDFELRPESPFRVSAESSRPRTSDGPAGGLPATSWVKQSTVSLAPPVLPPIPRVSSTNGSVRSAVSVRSGQPSEEAGGSARARDENDNVSAVSSRKSQYVNFAHPLDLLPPLSRPSSSGDLRMQDGRPATSGAAEPRMESSLFPARSESPQLPPINAGPAMSRAFIDSRDRPYHNPTARPALLQKSSTEPYRPDAPNMLSVQTPYEPGSHNLQGPVSPNLLSPMSATSLRAPKISGSRLSPSTSVEDLRASLQRAPATKTTITAGPSNLSGPTARRNTSSAAASSSPSSASPLSQTIGTPYSDTSASHPLPQHVATRPKTAGANATLGGVKVPTYHTSSDRRESGSSMPKSERRKTRLLNPMALLSRRKSAQESEEVVAERSLAAQAYARQRSVATIGVNELPKDFDPRIKGNTVHDFSAPRGPSRAFSYETDPARPTSQIQTASSAPSIPLVFADPYYEQPASPNKHSSDGSGARRSVHSPVFREMLAEDPDQSNRVSSLNAERLENKDFLQRVSHHSSPSNFSQESAVLPPFARRSQQMDPMQASLFNDAESKRSSDPSSGKERDSNMSSINEISPITARSSNPIVDIRNSLGQSLSPVSPTMPDRGSKSRPISNISDMAPAPAPSPALLDVRGRIASDSTSKHNSGEPAQPNMTSVEEDRSSVTRERSPYRNSAHAPEVVIIPGRGASLSAPFDPMTTFPPPRPGRTSSYPTPELTPEIVQAETMAMPAVRTVPKIVEKRASAAGHSKRLSVGPKHQPSSASRFSFQFSGESAAEEQALEEKHRKKKGESQEFERGASPDEFEEDDFDEDAMDDMDELEVQDQQHRSQNPLTSATGFLTVQQTREHMKFDESDDGSVYNEDEVSQMPNNRELTYAEHPDWRAHSAFGSHRSAETSSSARVGNTGVPGAPRSSSAMPAGFLQDTFFSNQGMPGGVGGAQPRSGFYMQPKAAGYSPSGSPRLDETSFSPKSNGKASSEKQKPRVSGLSLTSPRSGRGVQQKSVPLPPRNDIEPAPASAGLGLSGLLNFDFGDTLNGELAGGGPMSSPLSLVNNENRRTKDSETMPRNAGWDELDKHTSIGTQLSSSDRKSQGSEGARAYRGTIGRGIRARNAASNQNLQYAQSDSDDYDDMYFDDGGFDQDIRNPNHDRSDVVDEDSFDNDAFLSRLNRGKSQNHRQSAMSIASLGGDGPYPSFAMGTMPAAARQRQSQLLLEDLPLQVPVDPKLIPQRNPSEDAKRLGLSKKVPPLPPQPDSVEALKQMQANLQAYHAALAEAANRAASEGRFLRQPSIDTKRSLSSSFKSGRDQNDDQEAGDDRSQYSKDEGGNAMLRVGDSDWRSFDDRSQYSKDERGDANSVNRAASNQSIGSCVDHSRSYSPPKMNFDFGFDSQQQHQRQDSLTTTSSYPTYPPPPSDSNLPPTDSAILTDFDDFGTADDDIVAAANASLLASDDAAFYGQEFGFDSSENPNNWSTREPNLTPITERSEFSTRNSFVTAGGGGVPPSPGSAAVATLARMPVTPLVPGDEVESLRKLRMSAFGGGGGGGLHSPGSAAGVHQHGYFGGGFGEGWANGNGNGNGSSSNNSSNRSSAHPSHQQQQQQGWSSESPKSAQSETIDFATRRPLPLQAGGKVLGGGKGHERKGSDSVTYVREQDPGGSGQPRWVLERRRTSELGLVEVVGREVVQGGWI